MAPKEWVDQPLEFPVTPVKDIDWAGWVFLGESEASARSDISDVLAPYGRRRWNW